jgi:hypothetical protein
MENSKIKEHLLKAGVKNLKEFGYLDVTTENILTDEIYKEFFKSMLDDNLHKSTEQVDNIIFELLDSIK